MRSRHSSPTAAEFSALEAEIGAFVQVGNRLPEPDAPGLSRAHARVARSLRRESPRPAGRLRALPATLVAVVGGTGLWGLVSGLATTHALAAGGLAAGLVVAGAAAADLGNAPFAPSVLESVGVQHSAPAQQAGDVDDVALGHADDAPTPGTLGDGETTADQHGDAVQTIAKDHDAVAPSEGEAAAACGDGTTHGAAVAAVAAANRNNDDSPPGVATAAGNGATHGPDSAPPPAAASQAGAHGNASSAPGAIADGCDDIRETGPPATTPAAGHSEDATEPEINDESGGRGSHDGTPPAAGGPAGSNRGADRTPGEPEE